MELHSLTLIATINLYMVLSSSRQESEREIATKQVIARIKDLGGDVVAGKGQVYYACFGAESRLRDEDLKTLDPTGKIIVLCIEGLPMTDDCFKYAAGMTGLRELVLDDVPVTGSGLVHLAHRTELYGLGLSRTQITDEKLKPIVKLKGLRSLALGGTAITDNSLEFIGELKKLKRLNLYKTSVTDKGIKHLDGMKELYKLTLSETKFVGTGFKDLSLPSLKFLFCDKNEVTDENLAFLRQFTKLSILDISDTNVTDNGMRHLEKMESLRSVVAYGANVTIQGATRLEARLPGCDVSFGMAPDREGAPSHPGEP